MNRGTLRAQVLEVADATGSARWDATPGSSVDRRISSTFDRLWRRILNANRFYRTAKRTPTSDAFGRYEMSDLSSGSADDLKRLYRILRVIVDGVPYVGPVNLTEWAPADLAGGAAGFVWYQEGTQFNLLPMQANKVADAIWVNWYPASPVVLSGDGVAVDFPDGYEDVLIMLSAARLLMKGGAETQASRELREEVQEDYDEMLQDLARVSTEPIWMTHSDSAAEWAG